MPEKNARADAMKGFALVGLSLVAAFIVLEIYMTTQTSLIIRPPAILGFGPAFAAQTQLSPEEQQKIEAAVKSAQQCRDRQYRIANWIAWADKAVVWCGTLVTAFLMIAAGFRGQVATPESVESQAELDRLKEDATVTKQYMRMIGILAALVATFTFLGGRLESEQRGLRDRGRRIATVITEVNVETELPSMTKSAVPRVVDKLESVCRE